jgi:hypothetical protein
VDARDMHDDVSIEEIPPLRELKKALARFG